MPWWEQRYQSLTGQQDDDEEKKQQNNSWWADREQQAIELEKKRQEELERQAKEQQQQQPIETVEKPKTFKEKVKSTFESAKSVVSDIFKKKEPPKGDEAVLQVEDKTYTADNLYLNTVKQDKNLRSELTKTQQDMVDAYLPLVKKDPSLLQKPPRFSGDFQDPKEAIEYAKLAYNNDDEALKELIKQRLDENSYQTIKVGTPHRTDEIKDLAKQYRNQRKTSELYSEIINDGARDGNFREALSEGFAVPFASSIKNVGDLWDLYTAARKNAKGEELTAGDKAVLERAAAEQIEDILDPKSTGYVLGKFLTEVPAFITEFGVTKFISKGASATVKGLPVVQKISTKAPWLGEALGGLAGITAQTSTGFLPRVLEKTAEFSTDNLELVHGKDGEILINSLEEDQPFAEAMIENLPKGYAHTWVEVASESSGEALQYMKRGLLTRFFAKHADEGISETTKLLNKIGWNGVLEEIAEEEIAELGQAPIEGREYQAPLLTEEGSKRLILETVSIGMLGTIMKVPTDAYTKTRYNQAVNDIKAQGKELGLSEEEIDDVINDITTELGAEAPEEAIPSEAIPTEGTKAPTAQEEFEKRTGTPTPVEQPTQTETEEEQEPEPQEAQTEEVEDNFEQQVSDYIGERTTKFRRDPATIVRDEIGRFAPDTKVDTTLSPQEQVQEVANEYSKEISINQLNLNSEDFRTAQGDVLTGDYKAVSKLPILVQQNANGTYDIIDGNHRVAEALLNNSSLENIRVIENEALYRELSTLEEGKTKFRVKDDVQRFTGKTITDKQESDLIALNKQLFGDDDVKITLQIMANREALGSYRDNIIKIVDGQVDPKDTFYHEAVHKHLDVFTTRQEQTELFREGVKKYGTNDLAEVEENIAEDFISYAKSREGIVGKIRGIFDKVLNRINKYMGNEDKIDSLYNDILKPAAAKETAQQKEAKQKPVEREKPKTQPTGKFAEDRQSVQEAIEKAYGKDKSLTDLTEPQIKKVLDGEKVVPYSKELSKKFGSPSKGIAYSLIEDRPTFQYGGVSRGIFTDGFLLILDESAAKDINEKNIEKFTNQSRKSYMNQGFDYEQAQEMAEKDVEKGIEESRENFPEYQNLVPKVSDLEKAEIVAVSSNGSAPVYVLRSDNHIVLADANKLQFLLKTLEDGNNVYIGRPDTPIAFSKREKVNAVLMPLRGGEESGIEQKVRAEYQTPEPPFKDQPMRGTGGAYASVGEFASSEELEEAMKDIPRVQFPELVRLAKELTGNVPEVKLPRGTSLGVPNGLFYPQGDGKIVLNPNIFKDIDQTAKTLAHEIGHLTDYLPDKTMARGNLLGRIASLRTFMRKTFTDLKTETELDDLTRQQKQLQQQRRDLKDEEGNVTDTERDAKVLEQLKAVNKKIKKLRESPTLNNEEIFEELKAVTQTWKPFPEELSEDSSQQLKDLHAKLIAYRYSAPELYADAISMLFNEPRLLQKTAPTFYKAFFENLDQKPEAKKNFFELWDLINQGSDAVSSERQKTIRESFEKGEDLHHALIEEKRMAEKEYTFRLKYELIDRNQRVIDKVNEAKKKGKIVPDDMNPVYWLESHNYVGGIVKNYVEDNIQPIYETIKENDLTWEDLGEVLFLERVIKERGDIVNPVGYLRENSPEKYDSIQDRLPSGIEKKSTTEQLRILEKEFGEDIDLDTGVSIYQDLIAAMPRGIANPFGTTSESAQQQLDYLKDQLGDKRWKALQDALGGFREATNIITQMAEQEGFYRPELIKEIKANPAYATFQVLDYLNDYIPASIKHQVGTLKDVANPADSTITKSISIIRAIERNKVKKKIVGFMAEHFPEEIQESKYRFNGKTRMAIDPKDPKLGLITIIENGVVKGYYVDKYIADTMAFTGTGEANAVVEVFKIFNNRLFRPMFITFNLGFQSFNLFRDFFRFYKNIPDMSIPRALKAYAKALKPAARAAWDIPDATVKEMEKNKMLGVTYNDVIRGATTEDKRIDVLLAKTGVTALKSKKRPALLQGVMNILDTIERTGNFIERIPKIAGYQELQGKIPTEKLASTIRTQVGSPDFLRKGNSYKTYNEIFLFSNAIKEGIRSDIGIAINPETRSGYWFKTAKITLLPKLLMYAALAGFFGDKLKEMMEDVSEYDKTNYTIVPLGEDENGKTVYIRIPQDETGRLIGGIFWKMMRASNNNRPLAQDITDLLSFTGGQVPSISPLITSVQATAQFMAGKNPYDYFRGRPVIPDTEFTAGGIHALKPFVTWQLQTLGISNVFAGYTSYQAPETRTWVQKVIEAPVLSNIVGRWIKVSDYGKTERNRQIVQNEERENAKRLLEERRKLEDAVKEYRDGSQSVTRRTQIERQLVTDIVGDSPYRGTRKAKATNIKKKFRTAIIKGTADANITSLIYANTNAEKLALLREIKKDLNAAQYSNLRKTLIDEKIVSRDVFKELD